MLRLLHTADVHLGARHTDLGEQAAAQRERQFAAFKATIDLALAEKVDVVLIAGDLFDSNSQPKRSVDRVVAELRRLAESKIRTVIIPGTHDVYDRSSVYRANDIPAMAAATPGDEMVTVLTPDRPDVHLTACDAVIHARVFDTRRAPQSPLKDLQVGSDKRATWNIGLLHAAVSIPGRTDGDDIVVTREEIAATGLDYLALGHWHSPQRGTAGAVPYAYSGAPEPVAVDQDKAGKVLLVSLDNALGQKAVAIEERQVGRTKFEKAEVDAAGIASQPALVDRLNARADKDLVLDVRIVGVKPDELDIDVDEIEAQVRASFLKVRVRDLSLPAMTEGALPPPDTIAGAFIREVEGRIAELEAADADAQAAEAAELRDILRLGRLLLAGQEVAL
ncbi:MAG TPA: DNA repair exonuclease [Candidatus Limnocylindrales bacterium]|jgi:DNA repair exonuclease SbcCD nuclease subunit|nr:DNA repair exonuclease [Candidatus Limnocylindrales bacterium]